MNVQLAGFGIINSELCSFCLQQPETLMHFFLECKFVECFWNNIGDWISAKLKVNIKLSKFNKLFGFQENCVDYKFLNNLMLVARFFIYRCKYSKSKPNMLEYFNELNMNKKSDYIIAKRNNSLAEHYKKWRNICDFN